MEQLVAMHARLRAERGEWTAEQLAALDSLARAQRFDGIEAYEAAEIESLIQRGHVHGARKRLTEARRRTRSEPDH
ncbi:MAG: hypothetical protein GEV07_11125 [Streptosporangiales bacterium]|nr:hypothetical protein [Streptosporangiales bacterium]